MWALLIFQQFLSTWRLGILSIIVLFFDIILPKSRDSSVGIALGYWLKDRGSRVRFSAGAGNFSLRHRVQNGYGAHPATVSFPGGKAPGA
jgi:hypothetical protein